MSEPSENTASLNSDPTQKSQVNNFGDVPAQIGRYVIDRMIGSGGFGAVYLAFDSQLLRQVAIKIPRPSRHNNANFCNSFLAEARILARLDHPHIVPVYDVGTTDTLPATSFPNSSMGIVSRIALPTFNGAGFSEPSW